MNLPNFISLGRLLSVPVMVWLILGGRMEAAFWVFVAAGASDAVDGFLAKRLQAQTVLGGVLDPIADKALLVGAYVTLGQQGLIQTWLVILVVFRDLLIVGGALVFQALTSSLTMQPLIISKINTAAQIVLAAMVLARHGLGLELDAAIVPLVYFTAATTFVSGAIYVVRWTRRASQLEDGP